MTQPYPPPRPPQFGPRYPGRGVPRVISAARAATIAALSLTALLILHGPAYATDVVGPRPVESVETPVDEPDSEPAPEPQSVPVVDPPVDPNPAPPDPVSPDPIADPGPANPDPVSPPDPGTPMENPPVVADPPPVLPTTNPVAPTTAPSDPTSTVVPATSPSSAVVPITDPSTSISATATSTATSPPTALPQPFKDLDCSDFTTQSAAQRALLPGDPHHLDNNRDGVACEWHFTSASWYDWRDWHYWTGGYWWNRGRDGSDGDDGSDGKDGQDGTDGRHGRDGVDSTVYVTNRDRDVLISRYLDDGGDITRVDTGRQVGVYPVGGVDTGVTR